MAKDARYDQKRDFERTPEPRSHRRATRSGPPVFVVHRHEARRLHYDLRLEMEGALESWAVPKGFSYDPGDKHLAVHTEPHPIEYEDFHGVIPKGQYGAGVMTIWDRGHYEVVKAEDGPSALRDGEVKVRLFGRRLRGEWHLVRTGGEKGNEWLLFKSRDRFARAPEEPPLEVDLGAAKERPLPQRVRPMEAAAADAPFSDPEWVFELRFRGARLLARVDGDDVRLSSPGRRLGDLGATRVVPDLRRIHAERAFVDGVLVALDEGQRPSPERLDAALAGDTGIPLHYYVFDLLHYEDWDLRSLPLGERKRALRAVIPPQRSLLFVDHVAGRGEDVARAARAAGLDGIVAKRAAAPYRAGKGPDWREVRFEPDAAGAAKDVLDVLATAAAAPPSRRVRFTNLDKVLWPEDGFTKGRLIDYYAAVAELLVPYLTDRPVGMRRLPDGIDGKAFYQKEAPAPVPEWVRCERVRHDEDGKEINFIVCDDRDTLLYMANLASIDLHPWMSRVGHLDEPDWVVIDLDPDGSPFPQVVQVARETGKLLHAIGARAYPKTSGASGIHIFIPLAPGYSYAQGRMFCEGVARIIAKEHPKVATVERGVGKRGGKVYVDYLQNHRGQTVVPPYSARPVPGASVSTPLDWDELDSELDPRAFTIVTAPARFERVGDLYRGVLTEGQHLLPLIEALEEYLRSG